MCWKIFFHATSVGLHIRLFIFIFIIISTKFYRNIFIITLFELLNQLQIFSLSIHWGKSAGKKFYEECSLFKYIKFSCQEKIWNFIRRISIYMYIRRNIFTKSYTYSVIFYHFVRGKSIACDCGNLMMILW